MPEAPTTEDLLYAYTNGFFPMAHPEEDNEIYWHRPDFRGIIPLTTFRTSKNLSRLYRNGPFTFTMNLEFQEVILSCSEREDTWISDEIIEAYVRLHELGIAQSVEVWREEELVGGLYGLEIKRAFFGESMFSRESNTSKLALVHLVSYMKNKGMTLLDSQYLNDHIRQFGAIEIPDNDYMKLLDDALR